MMKIHRLMLVLLSLLIANTLNANNIVRFGMHISKERNETVENFTVLLKSLELKLSETAGEPVLLQVELVESQDEAIERLIKGEIDFTRLEPLAYTKAKTLDQNIPILALESEIGKKINYGVLCVLEKSSAEKVSDIKGKSIAFGLEESTERYIAQKYLYEHRIRSSDLRSYAYIDGYYAIISGLVAGSFDVAVLHERTFEELVVKGAPIRMLARFEITSFPWIARSDLELSILKYLQKTLLSSDGIEIFDAFRKDGFLAGEDDDFDRIRKAVQENHRFFQ